MQKCHVEKPYIYCFNCYLIFYLFFHINLCKKYSKIWEMPPLFTREPAIMLYTKLHRWKQQISGFDMNDARIYSQVAFILLNILKNQIHSKKLEQYFLGKWCVVYEQSLVPIENYLKLFLTLKRSILDVLQVSEFTS